MATKTIKILLISANPLDTDHLRLNKEFKRIKQSLEHNKNFQVELSLAATVNDIHNDVSEYKPDILHFSGHGESQSDLVVETEQGESQLLSTEAFSRLLALFQKDIQCVLLNACYSQNQAEAIAQHIDYVIGMNDAIDDEAAIKFSPAFYRSLAARETFPRAFEIACANLDMHDLRDVDTPVLFQKPELQIPFKNLQGIQFDAFISYAPEDDNDNWVKSITKNLKKGLEKELKTETAFCYIPPSQRDQMNGQRIERLQRSFLLIAIVTPHWLNNKFCQAEFNHFVKNNPASRIVLLERTKMDQKLGRKRPSLIKP